MSEPATYEYCTVAALQSKVLPTAQTTGGGTDQTAPAKLRPLIRIASGVVNHHCRRVFTPYTATVAYDAPPAARLELDDWVTITAITVNGVTVDSADWVPITRARLSPYTQTSLYPHWGGVRLRAGTWLERVTGGALGAVEVTGTRGYSASVPEAVERATLILAARQWEAESGLWQSTTGAPGFPGTVESGKLIGLDVERLLHNLRLED